MTEKDLQPVHELIAANAEDEILATDTGNARLFAGLYGDIVRYAEDLELWVTWNGQHMAPDPGRHSVIGLTQGVIRYIREEIAANLSDEIPDGRRRSPRENMLNHAFTSESEGARKRIISLAASEPTLRVQEEMFDTNFAELVSPTGTINLDTGKVRNSRPVDLNTKMVTVEYDEDATSPLLTQYLETFVPDKKDQDVLFAMLGYMARGGNPGRVLPFWIGSTTSGKSQLIAAVHRLLGPYACTIGSSVFRGNLDDKPRPDLVRAMYTRLAYAVEASKVWELHADQIKRLTGGDAISYRDLYSKIIEVVPRFTPLIVTNEMPKIKGADTALKRRMIVMRFDHTIPQGQEDTRIKERFIHDEQCLRALLARIVRGARSEYMKDGPNWKILPANFAMDTQVAFGQMDHVDEFLMWMREEGHLVDMDHDNDITLSACAKASSLHAWYKSWIKKHGDKSDKMEELRLKDFNAALRDRGWESRPSAGVRWMGKKLPYDEVPLSWGM